ncbi:MAG TPA: glycerol kinase [Candidatus Acetothermia bacterium]|nr:glycerol kinase [Candidatus Acetothermia bacterium]
MQKLILLGAIDIGTTGVRFVLYDTRMALVASAYRELPLCTPHPGWVEQDPDRLIGETRRVMAEALEKSGFHASALLAIGVTNQRESLLVWDRSSGRPFYPAIVWQDRRTAQRCEQLRRQGVAPWVLEKTGLPLDPYFSATKMEWLLQNVPGLRSKARTGDAVFGTVDTWILYQLTGCHLTDDTNASRTQLFDIDRRCWDDELLSLFGVPLAALPEIHPSLSVFAPMHVSVLGCSVPIAGVLGDQQASLLGHGITSPGQAKATWGTGAFLLTPTGRERSRSPSGLLSTLARTAKNEPPTYALEGSVFVAGAALQWMKDALGCLPHAAASLEMASSVASTDGVVFVPALTGLGSPHWDPHARGLIAGISRGTRAEHLVRAALESIAFQTHDVVRAMEQDMETELCALRVGGGVSDNDFLCQFQSDVLGIPVIRPRQRETTAQGAALAAGLSLGVWDRLDEIRSLWKDDKAFHPSLPSSDRASLLHDWHRALERAKGWCVPLEEPR